MNVNVTGAYIYFEIPIFGGIAVTQTDLSLLVVTTVSYTHLTLPTIPDV